MLQLKSARTPLLHRRTGPTRTPDFLFKGRIFMASAAQILANRENAKKSTGPTTDAGILKASQNAIRHSLTSTLPLLKSEQPEDARLVLEALHLEFRPLGANEEILVHKMAEHLWHQKRANRFLNNLLDNGGPSVETRVTLFLRYLAAADRGYYRGLNELRKEQKQRRLAENGSVSSTPEAAPAPTPPAPQKTAPEPPKTAEPTPPAAPSTEKSGATASPNEKRAA
jgi:hypothetical protein